MTFKISAVSEDNIEGTVNATCDMFDAAVDANAPPHLVLDATKTGMVRDTIKTFTKALALPTFSASYGQEGDLRYVQLVAKQLSKW